MREQAAKVLSVGKYANENRKISESRKKTSGRVNLEEKKRKSMN